MIFNVGTCTVGLMNIVVKKNTDGYRLPLDIIKEKKNKGREGLYFVTTSRLINSVSKPISGLPDDEKNIYEPIKGYVDTPITYMMRST